MVSMSKHALSVFHGVAGGLAFISVFGVAIGDAHPIVLVGILLIAIGVWGLGASLNNYFTHIRGE
jgi:hypothetical protein